eukprot:1339442-Alexandrium_andersonii.AAC.1
MYDRFAPIRKTIYGCQMIPQHARIMSAESLLFSRLLFNIGMWDDLGGKGQTMRAAYMKPLRVIADMCPERGATQSNVQ